MSQQLYPSLSDFHHSSIVPFSPFLSPFYPHLFCSYTYLNPPLHLATRLYIYIYLFLSFEGARVPVTWQRRRKIKCRRHTRIKFAVFVGPHSQSRVL